MDKQKITFKRATHADIPAMIELCNECFFENTPLKFAEKVFTATCDDPNQIYINGFLKSGEMVAHTKVTIIPTIYKPMETYAIINHFCVKPAYRRQHIATDLLLESTKVCKKMGCKRISLWSRNHRSDAHAFYTNYGFEKLEAGFFTKEI
jgi:ribosomal protein S18 acetylase RimI-like enzyme